MIRSEFEKKLSRKANSYATIVALAITALITVTTISLQAQTFTLLHTFTDGKDGNGPYAGLTIDAGGNLYGTAAYTNGAGPGSVFKMTRRNSQWVLSPLYDFAGGSDGVNPFGGVIRDASGIVYGTTVAGGSDNGGTVYQLRPSATRQSSAIAPWTETILYSFHHGGSDGINPYGNPVLDNAGNLYGTTYAGGTTGNGMVYELTPSGGGDWTETILHNFRGPDGAGPRGIMIFDGAGNLYGTTESGGTYGCGTVFEMMPTGSNWNESVLYNFTGNGDGCRVFGGVILDQAGNLYGGAPMTTIDKGSNGVVFELSPSAGGWTYKLLYTFTSGFIGVCSFGDGTGPVSSLTMDSSGALYGTTGGDGFYEAGNVFKLAPSNGSWVYTSLHDFDPYTDNSTAPCGGPVLDAAGNIYGTAAGEYLNTGTVWEVTP